MEKHFSAGIVVYRKQESGIEYLILHYAQGHWDFPKGNIEKGESPEETAKREIKEETSIKNIKLTPEFKQIIKYFYKRYPQKSKKQETGKTIFKIVTFYLAEAKTKKVKISWEHKGFKWLPYQEALEQLAFKNAKEVLKKANNFFSAKSV